MSPLLIVLITSTRIVGMILQGLLTIHIFFWTANSAGISLSQKNVFEMSHFNLSREAREDCDYSLIHEKQWDLLHGWLAFLWVLFFSVLRFLKVWRRAENLSQSHLHQQLLWKNRTESGSPSASCPACSLNQIGCSCTISFLLYVFSDMFSLLFR